MKGIKRLLVGMVALCFGLLFFFMYISTVWVLGVSPFLELRHNYALADRLRETEPTSWETLPSRDHTGTVLLQGHPSQYLSESSSLRTNGLYDTDQIDKPDFDLRGPSASVRVTNGCFREFDGMFGKLRNIRHTMNLGDSCYQLGDGDSSAAYGGFAPDDVVWVIGTWDDEALHAEAVFDGTPERYASPWSTGPGCYSSLLRSASGSSPAAST